MPRNKLSLPIERQKVRLKSQVMQHRVKIAEHKEGLSKARDELRAINPTRKSEG